MLHLSRWSMAFIIAVILAAIVFVIPNFFSKDTVANWPGWLPKQQVVLGLDLQGGSSLLYQLDEQGFIADQLTTLAGEVRATLRQDPAVSYSGLSTGDQIAANCADATANTCYVQVRIEDTTQLQEARDRLNALRNPLSNAAGQASTYEYDLTEPEDGLFRFTYNTAGLAERMRGLVAQSIQVISNRVNELGTTEPSIQREGATRILVEVPGLDDPQRLKDIIGRTAQMTFNMVSGTGPMSQAAAEAARQPGELVYPDANNPGGYYVVGDARVRGQKSHRRAGDA